MVKSDFAKVGYSLTIDGKYYNTLDIESFSLMMKDPSYCYKFYWLEAIVQLISEGVKETTFDAIIDEMNTRYQKQANSLNLNGINPVKDIEMYSNISEDNLIEMGKNLFLYFLHDDYTSRFRKILTIEQFNNKDFAKLYSCQYVDEPLSYQKTLFQLLVANGNLMACDVDIMTLQFFSPIFMLLTLCDREPDREEEALKVLEKHIRQFNSIYGGTKE